MTSCECMPPPSLGQQVAENRLSRRAGPQVFSPQDILVRPIRGTARLSVLESLNRFLPARGRFWLSVFRSRQHSLSGHSPAAVSMTQCSTEARENSLQEAGFHLRCRTSRLRFSDMSSILDAQEISIQRDALISAKMRFAPETQSVRESAVERLVKQVLFLSKTPLSLAQVETGVDRTVGEGLTAVQVHEVKGALRRLERANELTGQGEGLKGRTYCLTDDASEDIDVLRRSAQSRLDKVVNGLFKNAPGGEGKYRTPFMDCLRLIFRGVAETYVRLLKKEIDQGDFVSTEAVPKAIEKIAAQHPEVDAHFLERGMVAFLRDNNPDYDTIKYNMTQNYYLMRLLGLDPEGYLLTKKVFGDAILYIDTNILVNAVEPSARLHKSFQALSKACKALGINLRVAQISLDEHRGVVAYHRQLLQKVEGQIPDATAAKIDDVFFQAYRVAKKQDPDISVTAVFKRFYAINEELARNHAVELVDDGWFDEQKNQAATKKLVKVVQKKSEKRRSGEPKREKAALHDALMLRWIEREREEEDTPVWFLTIDSTLRTFTPRESNDRRPLTMTLDALLQWISPVAASEDLEEDLHDIFSQALKYQLLPHDTFLDLKDFLVFANMEWSCKELPAEDVEGCVQYIKTEASHLDPSKPGDREKISRELARYFVDPARKYKDEVARLVEDLKTKDAELTKIKETSEAEIERLHVENREALERAMKGAAADLAAGEADRRADVAEKDRRIGALEQRVTEHDRKEAQQSLRTSARWRLLFVLLLFLALEVGAIWLGLDHGRGRNALQRIGSLAYLLGIPVPLTLAAGWFFIGKERLLALGWLFKMLFRAEGSS